MKGIMILKKIRQQEGDGEIAQAMKMEAGPNGEAGLQTMRKGRKSISHRARTDGKPAVAWMRRNGLHRGMIERGAESPGQR